MDFDLMLNSFPKLLNATLITLKLLSLSLIIGLFLGFCFAILRLSKNVFINRFAYGYPPSKTQCKHCIDCHSNHSLKYF